MKWVTRERPKIDRIACPWLIERFIDRDAEFLYVPAADVLRVAEETGATPYDIPGVEMSHVGELCSFDAFLAKYRLDEPALQQLAAIVRGADTSRLDLTPQSAGLYAMSLGSVACPCRRPRDAAPRPGDVRRALRVVPRMTESVMPPRPATARPSGTCGETDDLDHRHAKPRVPGGRAGVTLCLSEDAHGAHPACGCACHSVS